MSEGFSVHWCALLGAILALTSVAAGIGPGQLPRLDVAFHGMAGEGATPLPPQMQEDTHQGVPTPAVSLYGLPRIRASEEEKADLLELARSRAGEVRLAERAQIVLLAEAGYTAAEIAEEVGTTPGTARKWCRRYLEERSGNADKTVKEWLADAPRVGRKDTFDELFWVDVLAIATSDPETYDRPITHWTSRELAEEVVNQKLAKSIHFTTIARFLKKCDLRPDRVSNQADVIVADGWLQHHDIGKGPRPGGASVYSRGFQPPDTCHKFR